MASILVANDGVAVDLVADAIEEEMVSELTEMAALSQRFPAAAHAAIAHRRWIDGDDAVNADRAVDAGVGVKSDDSSGDSRSHLLQWIHATHSSTESTLLDSGLPFLNRVVHRRMLSHAQLLQRTELARGVFGGRPCTWWPLRAAGASDASLLECGLRAGEDSVFMFRPPPSSATHNAEGASLAKVGDTVTAATTAAAATATTGAHASDSSGDGVAGVTVRELTRADARAREEFFRVVYAANYEGSPNAEREEVIYGQVMAACHAPESWRPFLGTVDGVAVCTASLHVRWSDGPNASPAPETAAAAVPSLAAATPSDDVAVAAKLALRAPLVALHHIATRPPWQRRGLGRRMLRVALDAAAAVCGAAVILQANPPGVALYRSEGFHTVHTMRTFRL